ncbi:DUF1800 domain-containing protein [Phycicoccus avicenniae]|uniref:DUF1800 domain-containing protein n=1 Tax=Phycicoccus avicenniae TaxID=2828860 RepID=UPI003D26D127
MASDRASASRALRALGFGGPAEVVDEVVRAGVPDWAESSLAAARAQGPRAAPPSVGGSEQLPQGADREERRAVRKEQREEVSALVRWWLTEMATTPHPVLERVTFGWHDHFATSAVKVRDPSFVLRQNETLRRLALGAFGDLAHAMAVDPAMLVWLDGVRNTAKAPNENLARELMELFCLGGGYTESDVKAGARALTGWVYARRSGQVTWSPDRHADDPVTLFGRTARLDTTGFVDAVLARPESAPFVATRWWGRVVSPEPPDAAALDRVLTAAGEARDTAAMLAAMVTEEAFASSRGTLVAEPVPWTVTALRCLAIEPDEDLLARVVPALTRLGQQPFRPPSVGGWPRGRAWLSTSGLTQRATLARVLADRADLAPVTSTTRANRVEAVVRMLGLAEVAPRTTDHLSTLVDDPRALVAAALVSPENLVI